MAQPIEEDSVLQASLLRQRMEQEAVERQNVKSRRAAKAKSIVITFGRFNPPTTGHAEMFRQLMAHANHLKAEALVFPTVSQDPKKNPLPFDVKVDYLERMFPQLNFNNNSAVRTPFDALLALSKMGYDDVYIIVGSDREPEFRQFAKYITPKRKKDTDIVLQKYEIIPSSDKRSSRTISASKLRAAAADNDFATFRKGTPTSRLDIVKALYKDVREYMGLKESRQRGFLMYGSRTLAETVNELTTMKELTARDILLNSPRYVKLLESKLPFALMVTNESYVTIRHIHGLLESAKVTPTIFMGTPRTRVMNEDSVKIMTTQGLIKRGLARDVVEVATAGVMLQHMIRLLEADQQKTDVGLKAPSEVERIKATQKQQEISLKSRQAQEILQAKQRELAKKTRDDMNKIKTGEKPAGSPAK